MSIQKLPRRISKEASPPGTFPEPEREPLGPPASGRAKGTRAFTDPPVRARVRLRVWRYGRALLSLVVGIGVWQGVSIFLPSDVASPIEVVRVLIQDLKDGVLLTNTLYSLTRVLVGFFSGLALAVPSAFILRSARWLRDIVDPWIQFARMIPPIALIPLVIVFFGIGELAKISVIFFAVYFIGMVTVYQGIRMIEVVQINAARVLGADGMRLFRKVILPASLPAILTAARLGIATGWTTLVASELIAASHGLGFMITQAGQYFDLPTIYLGIMVIGIIGLALDRVILRLERRLVAWADVVDDQGQTAVMTSLQRR